MTDDMAYLFPKPPLILQAFVYREVIIKHCIFCTKKALMFKHQFSAVTQIGSFSAKSYMSIIFVVTRKNLFIK